MSISDEDIERMMEAVDDSANSNREIVLHTGRGGMYSFETSIIIELCDNKDDLAIRFRITREELYNTTLKLEEYERNKLIKLLKRLKLINIKRK